MATPLDAMTSVIPMVLVGGIAMKMTDQLFGQVPQQQPASPAWQEITKREASEFTSKAKVSMMKKMPGKEFTWYGDKFKYENGQFFLA